MPEYIVTRAELLEIAKYWEEIFLTRAFFIFETGQIGSSDTRLAPFAERRVARITALLGDDAVTAVQEVMDGFAKGIGVAAWGRFCEYLGPAHLHAGLVRSVRGDQQGDSNAVC